MTKNELQKVITRRIKHIEKSLEEKGSHYVHCADRLYNFKLSGKMQNITPAEALRGMLAKHLTSVLNQIELQMTPSQEWRDEKIGDIINYFILLDALWTEEETTSV